MEKVVEEIVIEICKVGGELNVKMKLKIVFELED